MNKIVWAILLFIPIGLLAQKTVDLLPGEYWWGGQVSDASAMPFDEDYKADLRVNEGAQVQPLLVSNKGRYIWNERPFSIHQYGRTLVLSGATGFVIGKSGKTLADAQKFAAENFMVYAGQAPDQAQFELPVYTLHTSHQAHVNQDMVLGYAQSILDDGLPAGIIKIGDGWQVSQGDWRFDPEAFSNPQAMINELHQKGFKIMVWISPFVSPDSKTFRKLLANEGSFLMDAFDPEICKIVSWEGGYSAILDLTQPVVKISFQNQLLDLQKETGVDGFLFSGGNSAYYENTVSNGGSSPEEQAKAITEVGLKFGINEYDAAWKMGGYPLVHSTTGRLSWPDFKYMSNQVAVQGIMGYPYASWNFDEKNQASAKDSFYQELVVRVVQAQAFLPVMNVPYNAVKTLDKRHKDACIAAIKLHQDHSKNFMMLAGKAAETGSPMVQLLEYAYPEKGYQYNTEMFALGSDIIVAPVLEQGQRRKKVMLPEGLWLGPDGRGYQGPQEVNLMIDINTIPYFKKAKIAK